MLALKVRIFFGILGKISAGAAGFLVIENNIIENFALIAFNIETSILCLKDP
jgi:hypothetical protein